MIPYDANRLVFYEYLSHPYKTGHSKKLLGHGEESYTIYTAIEYWSVKYIMVALHGFSILMRHQSLLRSRVISLRCSCSHELEPEDRVPQDRPFDRSRKYTIEEKGSSEAFNSRQHLM